VDDKNAAPRVEYYLLMKWPNDFINKVIQGDCLEVMKHIPDGAVDLVLTDPPYGIKLPRKSNRYGVATNFSRKSDGSDWDDQRPPKEAFDEMFRVSQHQIVFGANYFWEYFYATPCYLIWDKRVTLPSVPFADTEFAWTSFNKMSKKYNLINHGFISQMNEAREHPTQKPLALFKSILIDFSNEGDLILDPFLGSGTTVVAAKELGRRFIGIEIEPKYCEIANNRLRQEILFK